MILILFPFATGSAFSDLIIAIFGQKSLSLQKLFVNIKVHSWETKLAKVTFKTDKPEWITLLEISICDKWKSPSPSQKKKSIKN